MAAIAKGQGVLAAGAFTVLSNPIPGKTCIGLKTLLYSLHFKTNYSWILR